MADGVCYHCASNILNIMNILLSLVSTEKSITSLLKMLWNH